MLARIWGGAALFVAGACPGLAGEVRGVDLTSGATGTRAEIRLQGAGQFKTLTLAGPDRLVVDLPASSASPGLKLPPGSGIVRAVRTGKPVAGTLRIVFDLAAPLAPLKPRMETVGNDSRLVLEWPGDGPAAPSTAAAGPATPVPGAPASSAPPPGASAPGANVAETPAPTVPPQPTAAQVTEALAARVARQSSAAAPSTPAPVAISPSPADILNGAMGAVAAPSAITADAPAPVATTATTPPPAPPPSAAAAPAPGYTIATGRPATTPYTIATGKPAAVVPAAPTPATPAAEQPAPAAPPARAIAGTRPLVVAVDAGHGGQDSGAVGPTGKYEKNAVLAIARELARQINATPGMKAVLVRDGDYFIPLNQRAVKARAAKADMFVSIHADAAENRNARGSSVYVLSLKGASSQRARWLADKENASDLVGGVRLKQVDNTLSSVLIDLAQSGHMKASEDAATHVLDGLKQAGNNHKPHIERANFAVLRTSDMPSMLVETAFISNHDEEARLMDPAFQRRIAGAVLKGVQTYFTRQPPPGTLFAAMAAAQNTAGAPTGSAGGSP